jgi:hypothetical protein
MKNEIIGVVPVYPDVPWMQCWLEDCRIENPHHVVAVGRGGPGEYVWAHPWDCGALRAAAIREQLELL